MLREILTYPLERAQLRDELAHLVDFLTRRGYEHCTALFGGSWGLDYYSTDDWEYVELALRSLPDEVVRVESLGFGSLGTSDLFVRVPGLPLEFHFCNDSDIHVTLEEPNEIAEALYQRWRSLGYRPAEWVKPVSGPPSERLRFEG